MFDLIHIGDYKTGTTWLQNYAFRQHPEIVCADGSNVSPEIAKLFYELVLARDLDFDPLSLHERFQTEIDKIDRAGKRLIVSRESLSGDFLSGEHSKRIAERIFQVFGPIKILLVVREQFSMLASIYSQYVKIGGTLSLRDFVWDPFVSKNLVNRLQYEKTIRAYTDIFGAENVSIRLFEELRNDRSIFLEHVFTFIGCKDVGFQPEVPRKTNPSLTTTGAAIQRVFNRFLRTHINPSANVLPIDKMIAMLLSVQQKQRLLESVRIQLPGVSVDDHSSIYLTYAINMALNEKLSEWCETIRWGKKIEVPEDVRERLTASFISGNHTLIETYDLKLEKYGWVL